MCLQNFFKDKKEIRKIYFNSSSSSNNILLNWQERKKNCRSSILKTLFCGCRATTKKCVQFEERHYLKYLYTTILWLHIFSSVLLSLYVFFSGFCLHHKHRNKYAKMWQNIFFCVKETHTHTHTKKTPNSCITPSVT